MNQRMKNVSHSDSIACAKYLNRILRQDKNFATKRSPAGPAYHEKLSTLTRQPVTNPHQRPRTNIGQRSPVSKPTSPLLVNVQKEDVRCVKQRRRSASSCASEKDRESWAQILHNQSKERISSFSNFDPLRTLHFLSKELVVKLQHVLPDEYDVIQIVSDIQHALKRIPPEVSALLQIPPPSEHSTIKVPSKATSKSSQDDRLHYSPKIPTSNKICQTPPTLYQEDTEKFQKIMEENTYRLEASCKQLELVCSNLQSEKEMTEKELDEARDNVEMLCKRVKELEYEMEEISNLKIRQLEEEKANLQEQLNKAVAEINDNATINNLKTIVEELKKQKSNSDETCARLEYDITLLKMEKEKFVTMLSVRDREITDIQEEMSKIQEQVNKELKKLNGDVLLRVNSLKGLSDSVNVLHENNLFLEFGDTTVSSITTNESQKDYLNMFKETPCGDAQTPGNSQETQDKALQQIVQKKNSNIELDLPPSKDQALEKLLEGLTPSCKALLSGHDY